MRTRRRGRSSRSITAVDEGEPVMTREEMGALAEGRHRAEEAGDIDAIVDGFVGDAKHDVEGLRRQLEVADVA
jgi:hypothetical protein